MKKLIALLLLFYATGAFSQSVATDVDNTIYDISVLDVKPSFSEGQEKLNFYINENGFAAQPKEKRNAKCFALFVVEKDGSLTDIKILGKSKVDARKSEGLIAMLQSLPKWNPGKRNGQQVRVLYVLPLGN
ncbi:energy transducer TonB [Flavobacterium restrictum]|uniref:TonB C-terminal domain-containing protein n=1 Tax=Flavobacterium restrictum TaxID=2594428 RepID=A0A553EDF3_9FLAO|nr:hypothetical protein [Flavobacterium restrictum]TRX42843.1 hypothetical protein FNW21_00495 [Flavobacterium restrictum]